MGKRKCPSYFGDYKCHVKTNVKDSKGNFVYVDKCLKEAVENLNAVGLKTVASCCGHGIVNPKISIKGLSDGKTDDLKRGECNLAVVSNRRELLIAFVEYIDKKFIEEDTRDALMYVDRFLKAISCC